MDLEGELVINGMTNLPTRKLRGQVPVVGEVPGEVGKDRSYQYLLAEERVRQYLWAKEREGGYGSVPGSPKKAFKMSSPRRHSAYLIAGVEEVGYMEDVAVQAGLQGGGCDMGTQTAQLLEIAEQDELIEKQRVMISDLRALHQRLKTAALGKAEAHREQINKQQTTFLTSHRGMISQESRTRKTFETSSLLTLRNLERERYKDSKKAITLPSPNPYDTTLAVLRLSVPESGLTPQRTGPTPLEELQRHW